MFPETRMDMVRIGLYNTVCGQARSICELFEH
jgi:hypothetical protein